MDRNLTIGVEALQGFTIGMVNRNQTSLGEVTLDWVVRGGGAAAGNPGRHLLQSVHKHGFSRSNSRSLGFGFQNRLLQSR